MCIIYPFNYFSLKNIFSQFPMEFKAAFNSGIMKIDSTNNLMAITHTSMADFYVLLYVLLWLLCIYVNFYLAMEAHRFGVVEEQKVTHTYKNVASGVDFDLMILILWISELIRQSQPIEYTCETHEKMLRAKITKMGLHLLWKFLRNSPFDSKQMIIFLTRYYKRYRMDTCCHRTKVHIELSCNLIDKASMGIKNATTLKTCWRRGSR